MAQRLKLQDAVKNYKHYWSKRVCWRRYGIRAQTDKWEPNHKARFISYKGVEGGWTSDVCVRKRILMTL